ncbi:hypothetical protein ABRY74_04780 [Pseudomonas guariconensis]|uniref:Uncharacterized protein n=1 Tax=Pseudomonas guariconensis TaxID=1288410 RepID=A0AAX0W3R9_9PSED|nr:hypothetical protein [Pseudomonas guariconensis]MBH3356971.1 hypothetical protein [Pseudomonas guariconensis]MEB3841407.1 hypothetical protein [Pseudomonas guariconensis]MEB3874275.1 hypothetical protein [Pseudomonas guariconensis]MEB3877913.1 hypothetical protein [Pseudomonas guariconensis]MEB3894260.1 hypothetical protein [Pseudomonas guariconensis]
MNAASESAMPSSVMDHESLKILAQWLKSHGGYRFKADDPRRLLDGRYPQGLISEAELEALMAVWH